MNTRLLILVPVGCFILAGLSPNATTSIFLGIAAFILLLVRKLWIDREARHAGFR